MNKYWSLYAAILTVCLGMAVWSMIPARETLQPVSAPAPAPAPTPLPQGVCLGLGDLATEPCLIPQEKLWAGKLMLIDPDHPLSAQAPSPNTLSVSSLGAAARSPQTVAAEETIIALREWLYAALHKGYTTPVVWAGTRSGAQQLDWQLEQLCLYAQSYPLQEAARLAAREREAPGCSEHQTGWAVDIRLCESFYQPPDQRPLSSSEAGRYLLDTCWRYGFIHRYKNHPCPEEAYHFRYVGQAHAQVMHALGLPMENYLDFLHEGQALRFYDHGELKYVILCQPVQGDWALRKPRGMAILDVSYDNQGYGVAVFGNQG